MDSDTKKFGHVRVADRGTAWIRRIESDHTFLATVLPIENLPLARVLIRVRNRPLQERHRNRPRSKTNESLACGLSKNARLRCPLWANSGHEQRCHCCQQLPFFRWP